MFAKISQLLFEKTKNPNLIKELPELPAEIWVKIFSNLDIKDFAHVIKSGKFFSSFSNDDQIWASMGRFFTQSPYNRSIKMKSYIRQNYQDLKSIEKKLNKFNKTPVNFSTLRPVIEQIIEHDFDAQLKFVLEDFKISCSDVISLLEGLSNAKKFSPRSLKTLLNYLKSNGQINLLDLNHLLRKLIASDNYTMILLSHGAKHYTKEGCTIEHALNIRLKKQAVRIIQSLSHEELIAEIGWKMSRSLTSINDFSLFIAAITKPISDEFLLKIINYYAPSPKLTLILGKCQKNQLTAALFLRILNQCDGWLSQGELVSILSYFVILPNDIELLKLAIKKNNPDVYSFLINHFLETGIDMTNSTETINIFVLAINLLNNLNLKVIDYYLQNKFDVNSKCNGEPMLHIATQKGNIDLVSRLLNFGANINSKNDKGKTALHIACAAKNIEMVESLISAGVDINAIDHNGETALSTTIETKNIHLLSILLIRGAIVSEDDFHKAGHLYQTQSDNNKCATIVNLLTTVVKNTPYIKLRDEKDLMEQKLREEKNELEEIIKKQQEEINNLKEQLSNRNNNNNRLFNPSNKTKPSKKELRANCLKRFERT